MTKKEKNNLLLGGVNLALGISSFIAILIITMGVVCRFILKISITWSDELLRTMFMYCYFIGAAVAYKEVGLMRLEVLDELLVRKNKLLIAKIIRILQSIVETCFWGILLYYTFNTISAQVSAGQTSTTSSTPAWVLTGGFFLGLALLFVFGVMKVAKTIKNR